MNDNFVLCCMSDFSCTGKSASQCTMKLGYVGIPTASTYSVHCLFCSTIILLATLQLRINSSYINIVASHRIKPKEYLDLPSVGTGCLTLSCGQG
jgi:hypothetical protein